MAFTPGKNSGESIIRRSKKQLNKVTKTNIFPAAIHGSSLGVSGAVLTFPYARILQMPYSARLLTGVPCTRFRTNKN